MSTQDPTGGDAGGSPFEGERLPPYAPIPSGWVVPQPEEGTPQPGSSTPEVGSVSSGDASSDAQPGDAPAEGGPASGDGTGGALSGGALSGGALSSGAPSDDDVASDIPPGVVPISEAPAQDIDTDDVIPDDVEAIPAVSEAEIAEIAAAEAAEAAGAAESAESAAREEAAAFAEASADSTTVLPVIPAAGDTSATQAIAGFSAASFAASSYGSSFGAAADNTPANSPSEGDYSTYEDAEEHDVFAGWASPNDSASSGGASGTSRPAAAVRGRDPIRTAARGIGQTLITLGVVVLLFVVYEVYVTDLFGKQKQEAVSEALDQRWASVEAATAPATSTASGSAEPGTTAPAAPPLPEAQVVDPAKRVRSYDTKIGEGFAKIFIPALGSDYQYTVVEGTTVEDLYGNPGHYQDTQYPGELGNFAVAGHRVSKGSPFNALDVLNSCNSIIIETQNDWFVYRVLPMAEETANWASTAPGNPQCAGVAPLDGEYSGVTGREIVQPSDYSQVLPIPHSNSGGPQALAAATQRLVTLTTCHPQFSDRERMIVHGVLVKSYAKTDGFLPPELNEV
ncbi:sortase [Nakamurella antarctica]|uniref:Sortase n=1 Tax=Nakamurella antarctica TaxID=1902245 RepID=A0A3G8ZJB0_9ACTN|nr:class E sortase [Nakamurella antarctica]AZI56925.1 sortase [Nakamurella antarctica]